RVVLGDDEGRTRVTHPPYREARADRRERQVGVDEVEAAPPQEGAEPRDPRRVPRATHRETPDGHAGPLELPGEVVLPGEQVARLHLEPFPVHERGGGDEQALGAPRTQALDQPQHPGPPRGRSPRPPPRLPAHDTKPVVLVLGSSTLSPGPWRFVAASTTTSPPSDGVASPEASARPSTGGPSRTTQSAASAACSRNSFMATDPSSSAGFGGTGPPAMTRRPFTPGSWMASSSV